MAVKRKNKKYTSIIKSIESKYENKNFEYILNNLTIEEIIQAKLELSTISLNGKLYGYPIYKNINQIVKESLIKFSLQFTNSQRQAAALLGLSVSEMKSYIRKHKLNIKNNWKLML